MTSLAHLDDRYFIDEHVYNCPFCNRNNVKYELKDVGRFDWTREKPCFIFIVECTSCAKRSQHLSYERIYKYTAGNYRFISEDYPGGATCLDECIFFSAPTSFFTLDQRIPRILRDLIIEAEGCLKGNFLTGASACARKIVYELAHLHEAVGDHYEDRIKSLKAKLPEVDESYFDTLVTIQGITSAKVHEEAGDKWESRHVRVILATLRQILHEVYVLPAERADRRAAILAMKDELQPSRPEAPPPSQKDT